MYIKNNAQGIPNKQAFRSISKGLSLSIFDQIFRRIPVEMAETLPRLHMMTQGDLSFENLEFLSFFPDLREFALSDFSHLNKNTLDFSYLTRLPQLRRLYLNGVNIREFSWIEQLPQLEELDLSRNPLTSWEPLKTLTHLHWLDLSYTHPSREQLGLLSSFTQLETLHLEGNQLEDLQFLTPLVHLEELTIDNNQITDVTPLASLPNLREVDAYDNPLSPESEELIQSLREKQVKIYTTPPKHN